MSNSNTLNNNNYGKENSMTQLELRPYSRDEIAKVLDVNIKDTNHFKRNVEAKLNKWGYSYEYSRKAVIITRQPQTADERLSEIMIRVYDMDIRIDTYAFSCFLYSLAVFPNFIAMPWEERAIFLQKEFGVAVSDRTLRSWCSRLIETNTVVKDNDIRTRWITGYCDGQKYRELVEGKELEEFADRYQQDKIALLEEYKNLDNSEKWNMVRKSLWNKYHCCVYTCKGIIFSAWNDVLSREMMQIVIELVNEIAEREPSENIIKYEQSIITTPISDNKFYF